MNNRLLIAAVLFPCALVDVPAHVSLGKISLQGALTIVVALAVFLGVLRDFKRAAGVFRKLWPLTTLFLFCVGQALVHTPTIQGFQDIVMLWVFLGSIVLLAVSNESELPLRWVGQIVVATCAISGALYLLQVLFDEPGSEAFIGARSFALYAIPGISLLIAGWAEGSRRNFWFALGLLLMVTLSLSRTALVVCVFLFAVARLRALSFRDVLRAVAVACLAFAALYIIVASTEALTSRFFGDSSATEIAAGDADLDTNGRVRFWALILGGVSESPWLGNGVGSASLLVSDTFPGIDHVHNEYLRYLYDEGALGLLLLILGGTQLLVFSRRAYRLTKDCAPAHAAEALGVFLMLLAVLLTMVTDNTAAYFTVMAPLGILVGCAIRPIVRSSWHDSPQILHGQLLLNRSKVRT